MIEPAILEDFLNLMAGRQLGRAGMSRKVFEIPLNEKYVVKIEEGEYRFQNVMEYEFWRQVEGTKHEHWFAPCHSISPNGRVLIMRKTYPMAPSQYPDKIPAFLTDTKYSNYGMLDGKFVCHDYGTCLLPTYGLTRSMRKVSWHD